MYPYYNPYFQRYPTGFRNYQQLIFNQYSSGNNKNYQSSTQNILQTSTSNLLTKVNKSVKGNQNQFIDNKTFYMVNVPDNWNGFMDIVMSPDIQNLQIECTSHLDNITINSNENISLNTQCKII
jgi:hypothetical protein